MLTSQVVRLCGGRERCGLLADPVTINILSGERELETSCHTNHSVLRTTSACIAESLLHLNTDLLTGQTETNSPVDISTEVGNITFSLANQSQETQETQESVVAKPLEPKPTNVLLFSTDMSNEEAKSSHDT